MLSRIVRSLTVVILFYTSTIYSADLLSIYNLTEKNDPAYLQEQALYRSVLESKPQALAKLLPLINLNADTTRYNQDISSSSSFGSNGKINYNNRGYQLSLTQTLYQRDRFIALEQSDSEIKQAEAKLMQAQQTLIIRTAQRYFNVLSSINNLEFSQAEVKSLGRQLEQTNQRFEVGLSTITDVTEAQAGYDLATARKIQAKNAIDNAYEAIHELTGDYITEFDKLGETISLVRPEPDLIEKWIEISMNQNNEIMAVNHAVEIARKEIEIQSSAYYPILDLVASHDYHSNSGRFGTTKTDTSTIGLKLTVPLYSGGLASSQVREAHENYNSIIQQLEQTRRSTQRLTREAYLGVISGISEIQALKQAVISTETALAATQTGFEVGTRTAVDMVASQRAMSEALKNYSQAKYNYILNTLKLKQAAGILSRDDVVLINSWLK